jgi:hypothetical protein
MARDPEMMKPVEAAFAAWKRDHNDVRSFAEVAVDVLAPWLHPKLVVTDEAAKAARAA